MINIDNLIDGGAYYEEPPVTPNPNNANNSANNTNNNANNNASNNVNNNADSNANNNSSNSDNNSNNNGNLPPGFTAGKYPSEFDKFFGPAGDDVIGYKLTAYTNRQGQTYYRMSISRKGAYGDAVWGSEEFGAPIAKGSSGWESFTGDFGTSTQNTDGSTQNNGSSKTYTAPDGKIFTDLKSYNAYLDKLKADEKKSRGETAFAIFRSFLEQFGLGALAADVEKYKLDGLSDQELLMRLRTESTAYKNRFAANEQRIKRGLRSLTEAEYIGLEDQYQDVMRRYGLPDTYYTRGELGRQEGFEKFISGDVSPVELEDRIQTAQRRVLNAPKEVRDALTQFYGAELGNGDILAYVLDPEKAIENIKRKVTAAEIGAGAMQAGLATGLSRAEELQRLGVTGEQARTGYQTIASYLPRASTLADIYGKQGMGPFTQTTAEAEVFGAPGAVEAAQKRKKLTELETAQFSGQVGVGALGRERAGQF